MMQIMTLHRLGAVFLLLLTVSEGSKILFIAGHSARSHYNVLVPIIEELANRKHDVTVQAYYTLDNPKSNVKEMKITKGDLSKMATTSEFFLNSLKYGPIAEIQSFGGHRAENCGEYLSDDTSKALVASGLQYDLVIVDAFHADCPTAVASVVGKHIINIYTSTSFASQVTSAPTPPSYVPHGSSFLSSKMNFFERFENAINIVVARYIYQYRVQAKNQKVISSLLPNAGTIEEIEKKVVFSITNGDPVVTSPRPTMPNIVHCGGMHCRKANPLPKELNDFIESSGKDGFIMFGLGSNVKADYLPPEVVQSIVSAFSRLEVNVIWKFEKKLENLPKNIKTVKWMPQQDLLGHPKIRLFITHSGLLSLQEAIYHGVPVLGMPFFGDQRANIIRMKDIGVGERFDVLNITADGFYETISKMLNDKSYKENMKKYAAIFKDQAEGPIERAIYWIEYVIRHDGARHFRSAGEDLNFFQYFLLDVVVFILGLGVTVVSLGITVFLVMSTMKKLSLRTPSNDYGKKQQ